MLYEKPEFITESLLDVDFYKFSMLRFIFTFYRGTKVEFSFTNRTKGICIADVVDEEELRRELEHACTLRFTEAELAYIASDPRLNDPAFIEFLRNYRLPKLSIKKDHKNGTYRIYARGRWERVSHWETIVLHTVSELYMRSFLKGKTPEEIEAIYAEGDGRLTQKIEFFNTHPEIYFVEMGTRRRFGRLWQEHDIVRFVNECPKNILGTSNVYFAMKLGIRAIGTMAHELFMGLLALRMDMNDPSSVVRSQREVLANWRKLYGEELSCALTDTLGTDHFFNEVLEPEDAKLWKSFRQDSGSPYECGEKVIAFYERNGIDASKRTMVASDGLVAEKMADIVAYFKGRLNVIFGWGTNATNDLGFAALSLVMKLVVAEGRSTVKLSDNLAKAIGEMKIVEWVKMVCGYVNTYSEQLVY